MNFSIDWVTDFCEEFDTCGTVVVDAETEGEAISKAKRKMPYKALIQEIRKG